MKTLVIIPTYNEQDNLVRLAEAVLSLPEQIDLLIVDDNSPDKTGEIADSLSSLHPNRLFVMHRQSKMGLGSAYIDGFQWGLDRGYEALCEMDADGSHDPIDLPRLIKEVRQGYDLVIGSRRIKGGKIIGWNAWRHLMSFGATTASRLLLGLKTKDVTAGYRCYKAPMIAKLIDAKPAAGGYAFQEEALFICEKAGAKIKEVPVTFRDREIGGSKLGQKDIIEFFQTILKLFPKR